MRWITFFILLYLMTALQTSFLGGIPSKAPGGALWPQIMYLPLLVVFYALYASESAAPIAAVLCGLAYDLTMNEFVGTSLIPLAIVGWLIVRIRLSIFREHFISQVLVTLMAILAFAILSALFRKLIGAPLEGKNVWTHFTVLTGDAVYTAAVAPIIFFVLFRFGHLLGFTTHGPRARGRD